MPTLPLVPLSLGTISLARINAARESLFSVQEYGAAGDGVTNDTLAIQAAHDACFLAGGGIVFFPAGTYLVGSAIVIRSGVVFVGLGRYATKLKLAAGANDDVIRTVNFSTLTGTSNPAPGETSTLETVTGPSRFAITDLTIDGNKANNSSGYGLRIYGFDYRLQNLGIRNCAQDGLYSEWGTDASVPDSSNRDGMEANIAGVKIHHNAGNGVTWKGPHDSLFERVASFQNTGHGFYNTGNDGGSQYGLCHAYANGKHGWLLEKGSHLSNCQSESHNAGWYQIDIQCNSCTIVGARVFASGATGGSAESGIRLGTNGVTTVLNNLVEGTFSLLNGHWVNFDGDGGANSVKAVGPIGSGATSSGTPNAGTVYQYVTGVALSDDFHVRQLRVGGGATGTTLLDANGRVLISATAGAGFLELAEQSVGPSTTANRAKLFARDNGAGKAQLCVQLGTGAVQVLATEP